MSNGETPMTPDEIRQALAEQAAAPQSVSIDGESASQRSADDLIKLADYFGGRDRANNVGGLTFVKLRPPGTG